jgi:hypothetical protein
MQLCPRLCCTIRNDWNVLQPQLRPPASCRACVAYLVWGIHLAEKRSNSILRNLDRWSPKLSPIKLHGPQLLKTCSHWSKFRNSQALKARYRPPREKAGLKESSHLYQSFHRWHSRQRKNKRKWCIVHVNLMVSGSWFNSLVLEWWGWGPYPCAQANSDPKYRSSGSQNGICA